MEKLAIQITGYNNEKGYRNNIYCSSETLSNQIEEGLVKIKDYRSVLNVSASGEHFYSLSFFKEWVSYTRYVAYKMSGTTRHVIIGISLFVARGYKVESNIKELLDKYFEQYILIENNDLKIVKPPSNDALKEIKISNRSVSSVFHKSKSEKAYHIYDQSGNFLNKLFDNPYQGRLKLYREVYLFGKDVKRISVRSDANCPLLTDINPQPLSKKINFAFELKNDSSPKSFNLKGLKVNNEAGTSFIIKENSDDIFLTHEDPRFEQVEEPIKITDLFLIEGNEFKVPIIKRSYNVTVFCKIKQGDTPISDYVLKYKINKSDVKEECTNHQGNLIILGLNYGDEVSIEIDEEKRNFEYQGKKLKYTKSQTIRHKVAEFDNEKTIYFSDVTFKQKNKNKNKKVIPSPIVNEVEKKLEGANPIVIEIELPDSNYNKNSFKNSLKFFMTVQKEKEFEISSKEYTVEVKDNILIFITEKADKEDDFNIRVSFKDDSNLAWDKNGKLERVFPSVYLKGNEFKASCKSYTTNSSEASKSIFNIKLNWDKIKPWALRGAAGSLFLLVVWFAANYFIQQNSIKKANRVQEDLNGKFEEIKAANNLVWKGAEAIQDSIKKYQVDIEKNQGNTKLKMFDKKFQDSKTKFEKNKQYVKKYIDSVSVSNFEDPALLTSINMKFNDLSNIRSSLKADLKLVDDEMERFKLTLEKQLQEKNNSDKKNKELLKEFNIYKEYIEGSLLKKDYLESYRTKLISKKKKFIQAGIKQNVYDNLVALVGRRIDISTWRFQVCCFYGVCDCQNPPSDCDNAIRSLKTVYKDPSALFPLQKNEIKSLFEKCGIPHALN